MHTPPHPPFNVLAASFCSVIGETSKAAPSVAAAGDPPPPSLMQLNFPIPPLLQEIEFLCRNVLYVHLLLQFNQKQGKNKLECHKTYILLK